MAGKKIETQFSGLSCDNILSFSFVLEIHLLILFLLLRVGKFSLFSLIVQKKKKKKMQNRLNILVTLLSKTEISMILIIFPLIVENHNDFVHITVTKTEVHKLVDSAFESNDR